MEVDLNSYNDICIGEIDEKAGAYGFLRVQRPECYAKRVGELEALLSQATESSSGMVDEYIAEAEALRKGRIRFPASLLFYLLSNELYGIQEILYLLNSGHYEIVQEEYRKHIGEKKPTRSLRTKFYYQQTTKDLTKDELVSYLENRIGLASTEMEARCLYHLTNSAALRLHDFRNGKQPYDQKTQASLQSQAIDQLYAFLELGFGQAMTQKVVERATAQELLYTKNALRWRIAESPNPFESQLIKESVKEYLDKLLRTDQAPDAALLIVALPTNFTPLGKELLEDVVSELSRLLDESDFVSELIGIARDSEPLVDDYHKRRRELVDRPRFHGDHDTATKNEHMLLEENDEFRDCDPKDLIRLMTEQIQAEPRPYTEDPRIVEAFGVLLRSAEDAARVAHGYPGVGEGWISETELYYRIKEMLEGRFEVLHGARPDFLGRQHLDIFIPELELAIEYQGEQHNRPIDFFGGKQAFKETQKRDRRKRDLCTQNGIELVYVEENYDFESIRQRIESKIVESGIEL